MDETAIFLKYTITPKFTKALASLKTSLSEYNLRDSSSLVYLAETSVFLIALTDMSIASMYSDNARCAQISDMCSIAEDNYADYFSTHYPNKSVYEIFSKRTSLICEALYHDYEPKGEWCLGKMKRPDIGKLECIIHHLLGDYIFHSLIFNSGIVCKPESVPYANIGADKHLDFFRTYLDNIPDVINNYTDDILKVLHPVSSKLQQKQPSKSNIQPEKQYSAQCAKSAPSSSPKWWIFIILSILFIIVVAIAVSSSSQSNSPYSSDNDEYVTESTPPTPTLRPEPVYNGKMFISTSYNCVCPFTVSVAGANGYYVYLKYLYAPGTSTEWRSGSAGQSNIAFYVSPGQTVSVDVPIGVYKLYYACGETWFGQAHLFGENTSYYSSDEFLEFYSDSQYYNGVTIELWTQYNGNFGTDIIDEEDFPS